jgi:hypothetical protein
LKHLLSFALFFTLFFQLAKGQDLSTSRITADDRGKILVEVFDRLEKNSKLKFFYLPEWVDKVVIEKDYSSQSLREALAELLEGTDVSFDVFYDYAVILAKDPGHDLERQLTLRKARMQQTSILNLVIGDPASKARGDVTISGTIISGKTTEPLVGATVLASGINKGVATDAAGKYSLTLPAGDHVLVIRSLDHDEKVVNAKIYGRGTMDVTLDETARVLDEVIIRDKQLNNTIENRIGVTNLKLAELKKLPTFLGEVDIIKQIQTLPGVTSVGEVSSGFNVRGGGADQNLVLYDRVPIFNASHVFGFFSSFNSEAVRDAQFFKAGIPVEYGGRISSVLSLTSKEGDFEKWKAYGGVGSISSNLTVEGPLKKNRSSVVASVRSSYSDWMLQVFGSTIKNFKNSSVSFYDVSLKLTQKVGESGKLSFSGYISEDHFTLPTDTSFQWRNILGSVHYDQAIGKKLFFNAVLGFGQYSYQVNDNDPANAYALNYSLQYPSLNTDITWTSGKHKVTAGLGSIYYSVQPPKLKPTSPESSVTTFNREKEQYWENSLYISDGIDITTRFHVDAGIRMSSFTALGPATIYTYSTAPPTSGNVTDSTKYGAGETVKRYFGPEPRASVRYSITPTLSVKGSFDQTYQYLHLISNSVSVSPIDVWQPSNPYFNPQKSQQYSLGLFQTFKGTYEASIEAYTKQIQSLLDFRDGSELILNSNLETALLTGNGHGYGIEFSFNKTQGRLTYNFNYTYSRTFRQVDGVNDGKEYPSNFDQPNIVNLNWRYALSKRFFFTGNFNYRTGRPVTVPYSYTSIDHVQIVNFSDRNGYRIPDYHRLDLAIVMEGNHRKKKFWDGTWVLSFYNVYARKNVYTVFYQKDENGLLKPYQMSLVGTIVPSLSYRFKI